MAKYEIKDGIGIIPEGTKKIVKDAFKGCTELVSIVIPDSVTEIGDYAFYRCSGLKSISIPDSVTTIGAGAFFECKGLTDIDIPHSVTKISDYAFKGCSGLTSIIIPSSVSEVGREAFALCTSMTSIVIPDSVTKIGTTPFCGCTGLKSIKVSEGNKTYDSRNNCNAIIETATNKLIAGCATTVIPDTVTEIGKSAFEQCKGLTSIAIPNAVTKIGDNAFYLCTGLTNIKVSEGNKVYDSRNNCNAIIETATNNLIVGSANTVIPDSVTEIEYDAFYGCTGLKSINIPASVTKIAPRVFCGCTALANITVSEGNKVYDSRNNCNAIIETATNKLIVGCANTIIPNSVTQIKRAFEGCTGLKSIVIPDSVIKIDSAFNGCIGLTSLVIPSTVTEIEGWVFHDCEGLKTITILSPVKIQWIFRNCPALETLTLGTGIKSIDAENFEGLNLKVINVPAKKTDYYKKRLPEELHSLIVELPAEKKAKK